MNFLSKLKKNKKLEGWPVPPIAKDDISELINMVNEGKVDMKKVHSKNIIALVKKHKSLDEQNKYLSKYL